MSFQPLPNESVYLQQVAEGNKEAYTRLYQHYPPFLRLYIVLSTSFDAMEMDDFIQEVFMTVWSKRDMLHTVRSFERYLFSLTRNLIITAYHRDVKRRQIFHHLSYRQSLHYSHVEEEMDYQYYSTTARDAMKLLKPPKLRQTFTLFLMHDASSKEISRRLNISDSLARRYKREAKSLILSQLRKKWHWLTTWPPIFFLTFF